MKRLAAALVAVLCFTAACSGPESGDGARTYFESLDLSSPGSAAEVFVEAYDADDFMTVWLVLDHFAQREWRNALNLLQYDGLIRWNEELHAELTEVYSGLVLESSGYWYVFDQVM